MLKIIILIAVALLVIADAMLILGCGKLEKQIDRQEAKLESYPCMICTYKLEAWDSEHCDGCCEAHCSFKPDGACFSCRHLGEVSVCSKCRHGDLYALETEGANV